LACRGRKDRKIINNKKGKDEEFPCGRRKRRGRRGRESMARRREEEVGGEERKGRLGLAAEP
jgi:hypothetical protein